MKFLVDEDNSGTVAILLDNKEAKDLATACTELTEPSDKPLRKSSRAYKLAFKIAEEMPCW